MLKKLYLAVFISIYLTSCGISQKHWLKVERMMVEKNYQEAAVLVVKEKKGEYGGRNQLLFYMDEAILLHHAAKYSESSELLAKAELLIEDLYTKSISTEVGALATNDNLKPYEGEDFEKALIHLISCLNFTYLGDWENALVEARKVDHKLEIISDRYERENEKRKAHEKPIKVAYTEDAFIRHLMGAIFEVQGEMNDSYVFYIKAYEAYKKYKERYGTQMPKTLAEDLLRITSTLGYEDEFNKYKNEFPNVEYIKKNETTELGQFYFVMYNGLAPYKDEKIIFKAHPLMKDNVIKMALPEFKKRASKIKYAEISINGENRTKTELAEDITSIATRSLRDRYPKIIARAIARLIVKEVVKEVSKIGASKASGSAAAGLVGLSVNMAAVLTENADLRSWRLLPAEIHTSRIFLPPGSYEVEILFKDSFGNVVNRKSYENIRIEKEKIRFVCERVYD